MDDILAEFCAEYADDPLGFCLDAFPWGEAGTEIELFDGPQAWQRDILEYLGTQLQNRKPDATAVKISVASGHGIGKSALVAMIANWAMSTAPCKMVVTANTMSQLRQKTWVEVQKWARMSVTRDIFTVTATGMAISKSAGGDPAWRGDCATWSEHNTEAFAGLHNQGKRILVIYDEASAIPQKVWEVTLGALTDANTEIIWICFGNPTRPTGSFIDALDSPDWESRCIDSRDVEITNKAELEKLREKYGEESDVFKVRVRGLPPSSGENSLFPKDMIRASMTAPRPRPDGMDTVIVLGVDVAREGMDDSCIAVRVGNEIRPLISLHIPDTALVADRVIQEDSNINGADEIFIDGSGGYGAGVIDNMRTRGKRPIGVKFNATPNCSDYHDKRSEMAFNLLNWIKNGGCLPNDPQLEQELMACSYRFTDDKFRLNSKDDMKKILGRSPDKLDACMLTVPYTVVKKGGVVVRNFY